MKKFFKWLLITPILFFGVWLVALFSENFRTALINTVEKILKTLEREIERSL